MADNSTWPTAIDTLSTDHSATPDTLMGPEVETAFSAIKKIQADLVPLPRLNTQTVGYTLALSDSGKVVEINSASALVVTVPANATVAFPIGAMMEISRMGAGAVTVVAATGVTIRSRGGLLSVSAQYESVGLRKRAADEWVLTGSLG